jgi:hypothetical protein
VGVASRLDLELYRSSFHETYEPAVKLALWRLRDGLPVTAALRAGADLVRRQGVEDRDRPFAQLLLGMRLARGVHLFLAPACVRHTPRLRDACNVPFGFTLPFAGGTLIKVEGSAGEPRPGGEPGALALGSVQGHAHARARTRARELAGHHDGPIPGRRLRRWIRARRRALGRARRHLLRFQPVNRR